MYRTNIKRLVECVTSPYGLTITAIELHVNHWTRHGPSMRMQRAEAEAGIYLIARRTRYRAIGLSILVSGEGFKQLCSPERHIQR